MKEIKTHNGLGRPVTIQGGEAINLGLSEPENLVHRVIGFEEDVVICRTCQGGKCWKTRWTPEGFADCLTTPPVV